MKKKVVAVLLVGAMVASLGALAGCGSSSSDGAGDAAAEEEVSAEAEAPAEEEEEADVVEDEAEAVEDETEEAEAATYDLSGIEDTYTLQVTSHDPETSATGQFLNAWAESVNEASEGHLDIVVNHGGTLAGPYDTYDAVLDGTVDIGWGLQSFYSGTFPVTEVFMLPLLDIERAPQGSAAIWDFYNSTDYMDDEYSQFHVLLLHTNCQSPISTVKTQIESVSDIQGMQLRGNAGPPTTFIQNLGANPVAVSINDLYSELDKGTLDGCITDWHAINSFKLDETIGYYLDENIGVSTYFMLMNQDKYDSLPEVLQQILDEKSAEAIELTTVWDEYEDTVKASVEEEGKLYNLSDEERANLEDIAQETIDQWIESMNDAGYDGQAIYDTALECIENAK